MPDRLGRFDSPLSRWLPTDGRVGAAGKLPCGSANHSCKCLSSEQIAFASTGHYALVENPPPAIYSMQPFRRVCSLPNGKWSFPMRRIAIINQKGGVGKTTTAVNVSAALAEAGKKVWLIDLDPQAHASLHLGFALEEGVPSMYEVLTEEVHLDEVRHQVDDNLWVSPSHIDLAAAEMELAGEVGREIILRDRIEEVSEEFDYIIFDCPPSLGVLTLNALTTANEVFLPLQPHFLALHGLSKLLRTIDLVARRLNPGLRLSNLIYCMFDSGTRLANEIVNDVDQFFLDQQERESPWSEAFSFDTRIRRNIRLAEAPSHGRSIFQYAPSSNGAQDYRSLAQEIMQCEQPLKRVSRRKVAADQR